MGANFINSCLEQFAETFYKSVLKFNHRELKQKDIEIIMSILSNFVPKCLVTSSVSCRVSELNKLEPETKNFAEKIVRAIEIANIDIHRAVTHNKGIMNGIDAVAIATGNDFRAIEAGAHAYASDGKYKSLSRAYINNDIFYCELKLPLAVGTCLLYTSPSPRD